MKGPQGFLCTLRAQIILFHIYVFHIYVMQNMLLEKTCVIKIASGPPPCSEYFKNMCLIEIKSIKWKLIQNLKASTEISLN